MLDSQAEGYAAFNRGDKLEDNPYVMGNYAWHEWRLGYSIANNAAEDNKRNNILSKMNMSQPYGKFGALK